MQAHRTETVVSEDGVITLRDVPFGRGESVEVVVLPSSTSTTRPPTGLSLRGTPVNLKDPTQPVAEGEWQAKK